MEATGKRDHEAVHEVALTGEALVLSTDTTVKLKFLASWEPPPFSWPSDAEVPEYVEIVTIPLPLYPSKPREHEDHRNTCAVTCTDRCTWRHNLCLTLYLKQGAPLTCCSVCLLKLTSTDPAVASPWEHVASDGTLFAATEKDTQLTLSLVHKSSATPLNLVCALFVNHDRFGYRPQASSWRVLHHHSAECRSRQSQQEASSLFRQHHWLPHDLCRLVNEYVSAWSNSSDEPARQVGHPGPLGPEQVTFKLHGLELVTPL